MNSIAQQQKQFIVGIFSIEFIANELYEKGSFGPKHWANKLWFNSIVNCVLVCSVVFLG